MSTKGKIKRYILKNFLFTDDQDAIKDDESFLQQDIIDSTGILEVISFLEDEFGISVDDEEMIPENLDSIDNLVTFVTSKSKN